MSQRTRFRAVVMFNDGTYKIGQFEDPMVAQYWAKTFDTQSNAHSRAHGGVYSELVWNVEAGTVLYEWEH